MKKGSGRRNKKEKKGEKRRILEKYNLKRRVQTSVTYIPRDFLFFGVFFGVLLSVKKRMKLQDIRI